LMWLGLPDPATALHEQVRHDPDGDALGGLMSEWHAVFGSVPVTVRKAVSTASSSQPNLLDAMHELPVEKGGVIDNAKLGWFLKKNANRIAGGFEFNKAQADGRKAWCVMKIKTPALPPLPASCPAVSKTVSSFLGAPTE
jgi:hypothetical protein